MIRLLIGLFVLSLGFFAPSYAAAEKAPVYTSWRDNIALSGTSVSKRVGWRIKMILSHQQKSTGQRY